MVNYVNYSMRNCPSATWGVVNTYNSFISRAYAVHDMALANCSGGCGGFGYGVSSPVFGFGFPTCYYPMMNFCESFMLGNVIGQSVGLGIRLIGQIFHKKKSS